MSKYIAFLRAINVGGHTVKMDHLKKLFERIGFTNVETFIANGNIVFETNLKNQNSIKQKIEQELEKTLGYNVATFIRTTKELKEISEYKSFSESDLKNEKIFLYIAFFDVVPSKKSQKEVLDLANSVNEFHFNNAELYWLCRKNFSDSEFSGKVLEKTLGIETTIRNSTTIKKIVFKYFQ
jgi:uncharacterized protein (DUF1697 family)